MMGIKKRDGIFGRSVIGIGLILMLAMNVYGKTPGNQIKITADGTVYGIYSLKVNQKIEITEEWGHNHIVIKDGEAYMEDADCPDGYCEQQGKISKEKETIVCLPHKLVVEVITAEEENTGDSNSGNDSYDAGEETDVAEDEAAAPDVIAK